MIYENYNSTDYFRYKAGDRNQKVNGVYPPSTGVYQNKLSRVTRPLSGLAGDYYLNPLQVELVGQTIKSEWTNRLYNKLRTEIDGTKGELLTSSMEWRTSLDMISGRVRQLGSAYLAVKKFRFKQAARILGIQTPSRFKTLTKKGAQKEKLSPTAAWLEFWMGWAPLHGDIAQAVDTLQGGPPAHSRHFSVGVRVKDHIETKVRGANGSTTKVDIVYDRVGTYSAYGEVSVANYNSNLANKMGFTNPLLTAWQMFPFSFIVDWFANIGTVLGSLTDFMGLSFSKTGTALALSTTASASGIRWQDWTTRPISQTGFSWNRLRVPGALPKPRLDIVMFDRLSLTRAATSISLLVEIFLRK